jgi:cell wall integrity and stress response component
MTTLAPTIQTVTAGGTTKIVTVTPTVPVGSSANNNGVSAGSSGLSTGAAVGLAVGLVALAAIIIGVSLFWCLRRRRKGEDQNDMPSPWLNSSAGIMSTSPKTEMSEAAASNGRPVPSNWETDEQGRRRSRLMPVDPRMNFGTGIYAREENVSHDSIHTMRDDQDYSRRVHEPPKVLRATNPDPLDD